MKTYLNMEALAQTQALGFFVGNRDQLFTDIRNELSLWNSVQASYLWLVEPEGCELFRLRTHAAENDQARERMLAAQRGMHALVHCSPSGARILTPHQAHALLDVAPRHHLVGSFFRRDGQADHLGTVRIVCDRGNARVPRPHMLVTSGGTPWFQDDVAALRVIARHELQLEMPSSDLTNATVKLDGCSLDTAIAAMRSTSEWLRHPFLAQQRPARATSTSQHRLGFDRPIRGGQAPITK